MSAQQHQQEQEQATSGLEVDYMADSKKYDGSQWEHSLRKLTTATEAVENPLYSDGTAITAYTIKGNTVQDGTGTTSYPSKSVTVQSLESGTNYAKFNLADFPDVAVNDKVTINVSGTNYSLTVKKIDSTYVYIENKEV